MQGEVARDFDAAGTDSRNVPLWELLAQERLKIVLLDLVQYALIRYPRVRAPHRFTI